ncbi:MAG TPA: MMPL family transporter, partial [Nocardioides sp.]|uniref:MMPL family transporter n=1 Tax=Nocardioides sp. TaxID=35761 RepID=UPI002E37AD2F
MHRQIAGKLTSPVTKWIVLAAWIVVFVVASGFAQKLTDVQNNEASSWLPSSAESTKALEKLKPFQDENDLPTVVVYHRDGGLTADDKAAIQSQVAEIQEMNGVQGQVVGPEFSDDGVAAQTLVTFNFGKNGWNDLPDTADKLRDIAAIDGVTVNIAGQGGQGADSAEVFAGVDGTLLFAALGVVILILLFTYRSPVLWILPIFSAMVALFTSEALIYLLAKYADLTVNGQSQGILTVLVIGAGTDYALLLVARYREELRRHEDKHEAMAFALRRAGPAIFASGLTVCAALLSLSLAKVNGTSGLGPIGAMGIAVAMVVMLTFLPALLLIAGRRPFWPFIPRFGGVGADETHGFWRRVGDRVARRPVAVGTATVLALVVMALGLLNFSTGLTQGNSFRDSVESIEGQDLIALA